MGERVYVYKHPIASTSVLSWTPPGIVADILLSKDFDPPAGFDPNLPCEIEVFFVSQLHVITGKLANHTSPDITVSFYKDGVLANGYQYTLVDEMAATNPNSYCTVGLLRRYSGYQLNGTGNKVLIGVIFRSGDALGNSAQMHFPAGVTITLRQRPGNQTGVATSGLVQSTYGGALPPSTA
ncbi:hypothetical protein K0U83_14075 [bacterium]|nr:hypothetical protein [bacterium]